MPTSQQHIGKGWFASTSAVSVRSSLESLRKHSRRRRGTCWGNIRLSCSRRSICRCRRQDRRHDGGHGSRRRQAARLCRLRCFRWRPWRNINELLFTWRPVWGRRLAGGSGAGDRKRLVALHLQHGTAVASQRWERSRKPRRRLVDHQPASALGSQRDAYAHRLVVAIVLLRLLHTSAAASRFPEVVRHAAVWSRRRQRTPRHSLVVLEVATSRHFLLAFPLRQVLLEPLVIACVSLPRLAGYPLDLRVFEHFSSLRHSHLLHARGLRQRVIGENVLGTSSLCSGLFRWQSVLFSMKAATVTLAISITSVSSIWGSLGPRTSRPLTSRCAAVGFTTAIYRVTQH